MSRRVFSLPKYAPYERLANVVFGLSFFSWAWFGLTLPADAGSLVRWCIAALHVTAGFLILSRAPTHSESSWQELAGCLPAFIAAGLVFQFAQPTDAWPIGPQFLFLAATLFSIVSLIFLGQNFAVFPAIRSVVLRGPYSLIRHPAYAGEVGLLASCVWAGWNQPLAWLAFVFAILCLVIRILIEERKLLQNDAYNEYCQRVQWRILPGIW